jgi:hypothetical protein
VKAFLYLVLVVGFLCTCSRAPLITVNGVITQQEALAQAKDYLPKILREWDTKNMLPGVRVVGEPAAIMMTVKPDDVRYCLQPTSVPDSGFLNQSKERLTWMVTYNVVTSNQYIHGEMHIYIDAKDGSFVCSTYPLILA